MKKILISIVSAVTLMLLFVVCANAAVARVDGQEYTSLQDAINAATGEGETIKLLADIDFGTTTLEIPAGYDVVLDLNGKVISGRTGSSNENALIRVSNEATLTVIDSAEGGKITMAKGGSAEGFTIDVKGNLILNSGTIELTGAWSIGFAVDVRPNAWGTAYKEKTTFEMNGGRIISSDGGVRVDSNSSDDYEALGVYFTMNGGEIIADWDAIMYQHRYRNNLYVEINDGVLSGWYSPIRIYSYDGAVVSNVYLEINGGTFNYTGLQRSGWIVENAILSSHESVANAADITVTGGTFEGDVTPLCKDGYIVIDNGNGTYTVVKYIVSLEEIFKDKGYSTSPDGITRGYTVDHELLATYMEQNGLESFEFGAVFGINTIDENAVVKSFENLASKTNRYNVTINGITENYYDLGLVLALYVNVDGETKYVNEESVLVLATEIKAVTYNSFKEEN